MMWSSISSSKAVTVSSSKTAQAISFSKAVVLLQQATTSSKKKTESAASRSKTGLGSSSSNQVHLHQALLSRREEDASSRSPGRLFVPAGHHSIQTTKASRSHFSPHSDTATD